MIKVNEETLRDFLSLIMSDMGCLECPWSDECDELDFDEDCVNLAIKCLQEKGDR